MSERDARNCKRARTYHGWVGGGTLDRKSLQKVCRDAGIYNNNSSDAADSSIATEEGSDERTPMGVYIYIYTCTCRYVRIYICMYISVL